MEKKCTYYSSQLNRYKESFYLKYNDFYLDVVENKDLSPLAFFKYIRKKYGSFNNIEILLKNMKEYGDIYRSNNIKIILDYKEACLNNNEDRIKELKEKFDSISSTPNIEHSTKSNNSLNYKNNKFGKDNINDAIDKYLMSDQSYTLQETDNLKRRMIIHRKYIDMTKYADVIIKYNKTKQISQRELDEIIEILKYFIYHLNCTLEKLQTYKNEMSLINKHIKTCKEKIDRITNNFKADYNKDEVDKTKNKLDILTQKLSELEKLIEIYKEKLDSIYIDGEEELDQKKYGYATILCNWKITKVRKSIKVYDKLLKSIICFKEALNDNKDEITTIKFDSQYINEDYLIEFIKSIKKFILGYNQIPVDNITEDLAERLKTYYIGKLYKD